MAAILFSGPRFIIRQKIPGGRIFSEGLRLAYGTSPAKSRRATKITPSDPPSNIQPVQATTHSKISVIKSHKNIQKICPEIQKVLGGSDGYIMKTWGMSEATEPENSDVNSRASPFARDRSVPIRPPPTRRNAGTGRAALRRDAGSHHGSLSGAGPPVQRSCGDCGDLRTIHLFSP